LSAAEQLVDFIRARNELHPYDRTPCGYECGRLAFARPVRRSIAGLL